MQRFSKACIFIISLIPFTLLLYNALNDNLGANPIEVITHSTGDWALNFLLITLSVTPLRKLTGQNLLIRYRRMLGLFAFFYVCMHFLCFLVLDHFFDWQTIIEDIIKRPYITVGFIAFILIIPLAITSSKSMMMKLGRSWNNLHRLIYLICPLGVLHYLWLVKSDITAPLIYAIIYITLMSFRFGKFPGRKNHASPVAKG